MIKFWGQPRPPDKHIWWSSTAWWRFYQRRIAPRFFPHVVSVRVPLHESRDKDREIIGWLRDNRIRWWSNASWPVESPGVIVDDLDGYLSLPLKFRFRYVRDAVFFKLRWG